MQNSHIPKAAHGCYDVRASGCGKDHYCRKARRVAKQGKRPLLRLATFTDRLPQSGYGGCEKLGLSVFHIEGCKDPVKISTDAIEHAKNHGNDIVIIDTAGRLHIDEQLMDELKNIKEKASVTETLLVVDAMTGQDAVNVAKSFNDQLEVDGVILTKLDGDARGGAALSIRAVTQKPIKYIGTGEKLEDLSRFTGENKPYRHGMFSRLLKRRKRQSSIKAEELEKNCGGRGDLNGF